MPLPQSLLQRYSVYNEMYLNGEMDDDMAQILVEIDKFERPYVETVLRLNREVQENPSIRNKFKCAIEKRAARKTHKKEIREFLKRHKQQRELSNARFNKI